MASIYRPGRPAKPLVPKGKHERKAVIKELGNSPRDLGYARNRIRLAVI